MSDSQDDQNKRHVRFPVYIDRERLRLLRAKLMLEGNNVSKWFREQVNKKINE